MALWDQLGCLSPLAVYAVGGSDTAPDRLAERLAQALEALERRLPRGKPEAAAAAAFRVECDAAELRAAAGERVRLFGGAAQRFAVVREADAAPAPGPAPPLRPRAPRRATRRRCSRRCGRSRRIWRASRSLASARGADAVARGLAELGASRLCRPGELQAPPLAWRHENRPVLLPFARFTDREAWE